MQPRPAVARRHDQPGRRRVHAARQRQGDARPLLPVHAVLRGLGRLDPGHGRHARRLGRATARSPPRHPCLRRRRIPVARLVHRRADGRLDRRPEVRRTRRRWSSQPAAFTATFSTTLSVSRPGDEDLAAYSAITADHLLDRPGTTTPITPSFDRPSNAIGILFVPMGDATKTYSSQWTADSATGAPGRHDRGCRAPYPLPAGIGNLGGTGGLRYMVTPTLLDLETTSTSSTARASSAAPGANYDADQGAAGAVPPLAQRRQSRPRRRIASSASSTRPSGSGRRARASRAWRSSTRRRPGRSRSPASTGSCIGLELAHTLGLTPPSRESPFDGAHSQNIAAENPSLNRRYNVVQRGFIATDRSLMKPSATSPVAGQRQHAPRGAGLRFPLLRLRRDAEHRVPDPWPRHRERERARRATLSFVMSGTTTGDSRHLPDVHGSGAPAPASSSPTSRRRSRRRRRARRASTGSSSAARGARVLSNLGVPVRSSTPSTGPAR